MRRKSSRVRAHSSIRDVCSRARLLGRTERRCRRVSGPAARKQKAELMHGYLLYKACRECGASHHVLTRRTCTNGGGPVAPERIPKHGPTTVRGSEIYGVDRRKLGSVAFI